MTYQVLARKWRPKSFAELVGQEHVVRALTHALDQNRLHHAYLFTGTRGVGKTTIARILAKALNCETGVKATPCGRCSACVEIDTGRFVDLLEVDAATNTRVDEMRQLLENAIYAPTRGRYKVYVIDEVHMLSNSAFNAMLKTLEEPPEHMKFILATTDPQKIPVTVLSRCLQFNLKQMPATSIANHLRQVCLEEGVDAEDGALRELAHAARGSMRDSLSLLDQAISYSAGNVTSASVRTMLGTVDRGYLYVILERLAEEDLPGALRMADEMASRSVGFDSALSELASILQLVAIRQAAPEIPSDLAGDGDRVEALAAALDPETVQLYYQIALHGRKDLSLAPDEQAGFTMTLIRMGVFGPLENPAQSVPGRLRATPTKATGLRMGPAACEGPASVPEDLHRRAPSEKAMVAGAQSILDDWATLVPELGLSGAAKQLAERCELVRAEPGRVELRLSTSDKALAAKPFQDRLREALCARLGEPVFLSIAAGETAGSSVAARTAERRESHQREAESKMRDDPFVRDLVSDFGATIQSVKTVSEGH